MNRMFRAFDVTTGAELWWDELPTDGMATPMTYAAGGRQFVVIAVGGHAYYRNKLSDYIIAYTLPEIK